MRQKNRWRFPKDIEQNMRISHQTQSILREGNYELSDEKVFLKLLGIQQRAAKYYDVNAVEAMREHPINNVLIEYNRCRYSVVNQDAFEVAREITADSLYQADSGRKNVLVLNCADPRHAGGDINPGTKSQEKDFCRRSSLLRSLQSLGAYPYYEEQRKLKYSLASDSIILSPEVEIIRGSNDQLLPETTVVAVLSCAAPMIGQEDDSIANTTMKKLFYDRIMGILHVAAYEGYKYLILGDWGCGTFGNDPKVISDLFYKALKNIQHNEFHGKDVFRQIVFAVLDFSEEEKNFKAFQSCFADFCWDGNKEE